MTDEHDTPISDEQEDEVRRLLAEARHDEPMPPDVVARMDRVLDDLAAEPARRAPVVHLAARRRRAASMLVAAAAVVVVGIGIGQVIGATGGDDQGEDSVSSGQAADSDAGGTSAEKRRRNGADEEPAPSELAGNPAGSRTLVEGKSFVVDPDELSRDLRKVQLYAERNANLDTTTRLEDRIPLAGLPACPTRGLGEGTYVPLRYGDQPAILVLRPPEGETQVADVYLCGSRDPVRSLTLRLPPP